MNISPDMEKLKMMQDVELTLGLGKIEYHNKNLGLAFIALNEIPEVPTGPARQQYHCDVMMTSRTF